MRKNIAIPVGPLSDNQIALFHRSYIPVPECGCWLWERHRNRRNGYGVFQRTMKAHRVSYTVFKGPIPDGLWVLHKCDNPCCVNPDHLFIGDAVMNEHDKISKQRHMYGTKHHGAKLTDKDVLDIRAKYAKGNVTVAELGAEYGVIFSTIARAIKGESWKHLPGSDPSNHSSKMVEYNGELKTLTEWARLHGLIPDTVLGRVRRGWNVKDALSCQP